ncbi:NAD-dependent epimerase/dehydratase family protein [Chloroflexota bacterium]
MSDTGKYAILGSNCFSASCLVDLLLEDSSNHVVGISRSPEKSALYLPYKSRDTNNFRFYQVDMVREPDKLISLLDEIEPDHIINFAALSEVNQSHETPNEYFDINTSAVVRLCHQLRNRDYLKCYVHTSSAEIYGPCKEPITEEVRLNPTTPYAISKAAADYYLLTLYERFNFPAIIIRSTNVYGKHQQLFKIIPRTIIYLKQGKKIELHDAGRAVRPFIHIRDVERGVIKAMQYGKPGNIYHFSTDFNHSIADVVRMTCQQMGYDFETSTVTVSGRPGQDSRYLLDYSKAIEELDWAPEIPFEEGLKEVISWVNDNWQEILKEPLVYVHKV